MNQQSVIVPTTPFEGEILSEADLRRFEREEVRARALRSGPRRILLIGGAGYIGGPVTTELLRSGVLVRNLDLLVYENQAAIAGHLPHPAYEFMFGDMADPESRARALDGVTDVVILAGLVGDPITKKYPDASHAINEAAIRSLIDTLDGRGLNKVVFISTCSNYGMIPEGEIADEETELKPLSLYASAKVAAEKYILSLRGKVDYSPTILRFATAFGLAPRMRFDLTVNEFARELFLGRELEVYDPHTWRPYCHVKDFARLIRRVLEFPRDEVAFEVFNAGGDANNHTKDSIVGQIRTRVPEAKVAYRENSSDPRNYRVSFEKVRAKLGFEPRYSVGDGIDETLWALRNHLFDDAEARVTYFGNHALARTSAAAPVS